MADRTFGITRGKGFLKDLSIFFCGLPEDISCILTMKKVAVEIFCRRNSKGINSNKYCRKEIFKMPRRSQWVDLQMT